MAASHPGSRRSRLRIVVIQALVFSLFATLFVRLYYLQVVGGESYQARAASQSVRDIVVQPPRGLIVDAEGRPLVANRTSWVISIDRTMLGKLPDGQDRTLLRRVSRTTGVPVKRIRASLVTCGEDGAEPGVCWNGSPYQPVPVASDVKRAVALRVLEQPEDFPSVLAEAQTVRRYPQPFGANLAHVLGYLSPITAEEFDQATAEEDESLNGASVVGRAGVEKSYDKWLRGMPGHRSVRVDSMGRVLGERGLVESRPGNTLVTSVDSRLQALVERELHRTLLKARQEVDPVTHRRFEADSGAVVVMDTTGQVIAMASEPTYDPKLWVGGISKKQLARLYSEDAGTPLLARATQAQLAPGSTWKPFMSVSALRNGYTPDTRLECSSGLQVGNRVFKNYESAAAGYIGFDRALQISCNTFFYRIGYNFWQRYGSDPTDVDAFDPLVEGAQEFGFGEPTGVDLPGEASGRIADRRWKQRYYEAMRDHYCEIDEKNTTGRRDFESLFAHEFCLEGNYYRAGDAVNFSIGQGDTLVTPLQLARGYATLANGGTLYEPRIAKAIVDPDGKVVKRIKPKAVAKIDASPETMRYVDQALLGTSTSGTLSWKLGGFPLNEVKLRAKTGSAEVWGKQSSSWLATYDENFVVVMMVTQGGTGSGRNGDSVRRIWESLYGIQGGAVSPSRSVISGVTPPERLPSFQRDGAILPPKRGGDR